MNNKVFIGNLPWAVSTSDLSKFLGDMGFTFHSVKVILDRDTGRSRGFAFVEFATEAEAFRAIQVLTDYTMDGRALVANEARPREQGGGDGSPGRGPFPQGDDRRDIGKSRDKSFRSMSSRFESGRSRRSSQDESSGRGSSGRRSSDW